nr:serine/threonine-protein kinase [Streptomyces aidingensis]
MSCQRPNCPGTYEDMGGGERYCDTCGLAPVVSAASLAGPPRAEPGGGGPPEGPPENPPGGPGGDGSAGSSAASRSSSRSSSRSTSRSQMSRRSVSGRLSRALSGRLPARSVAVRSSRSSASTGRGRLGAGIVTVPTVPRPDPRSVVLEKPEVPERKRYCGNPDCQAPVGRSRGDVPGRTEGFCTKCGHPYSFVPKLNPGDTVGGQYEVVGCIAHGGLGWIYLAIDHPVGGRWVVLKGLLDTGDQDAMQAAIAERRFLSEIEHAAIVRIYNFVEHLDRRTGSLDGYIVMEYVGGKSLKEIANERRTPDGHRDPLPVEQACAYGIEALDALGHLHSRNLLYCDFKVDNAIQQGDQLKVIDMGAVRRMDDDSSPLYGTIGYQAPEVAELGPSVASDLYTVARTLAVLTFDFRGYTGEYADSLPEPEEVAVFRRYESFYRLLVRATDPDPHRRFASAEEMAEQLTGVLREIAAMHSGRPRPAVSPLFGPELRVTDTELLPRTGGADGGPGGVSRLGRRPVSRRERAAGTAAAGALPPAPAAPAVVPLDVREAALALPVPKVDPADPNAGFLAGLVASDPADLLNALRAAPADSAERRLRELRAWLELSAAAGEPPRPEAGQALAALESDHPDDWRVVWYRALTALIGRDWETAALSFDAVYDAFPGEVAPKLALAVCAEVLGQLDNAADYYDLVWTTDPSHVSAGFGLARVRLARGDREGAVRALESVPAASAHWTASRVAAIRARLRQRLPSEPLLPDLLAASRQLAELRENGLEPALGEQLSCEVLGTALDWHLAGRNGGPQPDGNGRRLLGRPLDETGLRLGLEHSYRVLARLAPSSSERIDLVEAANRFRPRTWV